MEINNINKKLYELAFIQNGEYGYHEDAWKPSINENEISEMCCDENGNYIPATPLGYRDYKISRLQGLKNILDQHPFIDLNDDKHYNVKRNTNIIKLYDKVKINNEFFVVVGDTKESYFVANEEGKCYYVDYVR